MQDRIGVNQAALKLLKRSLAERRGQFEEYESEDKKVKEHPACYYNQDGLLLEAVLETPWLLKAPIVRNGRQATVGYCPEAWEKWE